MKKRAFINLVAILLICLISCRDKTITLKVSNPLEMERSELAQIDAAGVAEQFPDGFILLDSMGSEIPFQITYDGKLLFPVEIDGRAAMRFTVKTGKPSRYVTRVYGRHFPEHKDNFSWENDKSAYTAYGPALQAAGEKGYGYDIWTKSVDSLVLEDRYRLDAKGISMHKDNGTGMDAYIVASTLGGGTAALLDNNGDIIYPWAWQKCEVLDNGPLRLTARLTYSPAVVDNDSNVVEQRIISLDAGSWLNHTEVSYSGLTTPHKIVAGPVVHVQNPYGYILGDNYVAYVDSTDATNANNGVIMLGTLVLENNVKTLFKPIQNETRDAVGHALVETDFLPGKTFEYYWGSAWSKGNSPENWEDYLKMFKIRLDNPLQVTIQSN